MKKQFLCLVAILTLCLILSNFGYSQTGSVLKQMNNSNWDDQFGTQGLNGSVTALDVYGGYVYAGGSFTDAGGVAVSRIAKWDGSSWSSLGTGVNARVREIVVNLNKIYAGGSFTTAGSISANHIAVWDGSNWSALDSGVDGDVYAIAVKGNEVYVGGDFQKAGGITVNNIAIWDGSSWSAVDNGGDNITLVGKADTAVVYDILIRGSSVFVGGKFDKASSTSAINVAYWDGSSWHAMGDGIKGDWLVQPLYILSFATDWQHIYAGSSAQGTMLEYFDGDDAYFIHYAGVYQWSSGMGWSSQGGAFCRYYGEPNIHSLDYSSGLLFAGGDFYPDTVFIGDEPFPHDYIVPSLQGNNIIQWDGSEWNSLGSGTNGTVYEIVARPGEVWVGGDFSKAGNKASHNIAHYVFDSFPDLTCIYVPGDYPTIQEAIDAATDNDTIMVAPGTYNIDAAITNDRVNNLKIYGSRQEDGSDASIIDASVNPGEHFCFSIQNVTDGEISGFEIKNGVVGVFYDNCMNCKCSNNYIHHQHTISGPDVPCGISICRSTEIEVEFCILDSNQVKGIDIWQGENITIINNTIVNNGDKCGCWINNSDSITVKNNILAYNDTDGIGINNCTFTEFIHDYNCFWQNTTDPLQGYTPGTHSLESDPLFVDLSQSDYYLQTGSPCLGTGEGGVDIGALGETTSQEYENEISDMFSSQKIISTAADGAKAIYAVDLDGDGDQDVLSASSKDDKIAWYENDGSGGFSSQKIISTAADGAQSIYAADLDGDGDQDVLSASSEDNKIAWYENDGNGGFSSQKIISTAVDGAQSIYAADLDGDGDQDVLSASSEDNKIAWYENDGSGGFSSQKIISTEADGAKAVYAIDLDGDGDQDVLSASELGHKISWYENDGSSGFSSEMVITTEAWFATYVYAADLDGDGDQDVLSASDGEDDDKIAWYENDGSGGFSNEKIITTEAIHVESIYTNDLDGDADQDVLSASWLDDKIAWYENNGSGGFSNQKIISTEADNVMSVYAADLDGDGDQDVLSASYSDDKIAWYENLTSIIYQDDFNDNTISDTTWQVMETAGTNVIEQNQRLEMETTEIANAQVNSRFLLQGDFDLRIDFKVCPNEVNGNGLGITVFDEDNGYSINRLYDGGWSTSDGKNGHMYMSNFDGDYSSEGRLSTSADDTTGTLRLTRTGSTITSYFQRDHQWIELKSKIGSTEDLYLSLYVMVYGTSMPLEGWADNFTITKGTLLWPEVVSLPESPSQTVNELLLFQNYPNPFNAFTRISYSLPASSRVRLTIYNLKGEEVVTLFEGQQESGKHTVTWDACYSNGHPVASGIYLYRLKTDNNVTTRKLLLMK